MNSLLRGAVAVAILVGSTAVIAVAQTTTPATGSASATTPPPPLGAGTPSGATASPNAGNMGMANPAAPTPAQTPVNGQLTLGAKPAADPNANTAAFGSPGSATPAQNANVATTPAKGANSFTLGEAQRRLTANGFTSVSDLKLDPNGIWRANATKDGKPVQAWLDYKGQVGQR